MTDNIGLDGKVAIVTGSGRGLGQAMALVKAGANVIATDIIDENLEQLGKEAASLSSATRPNTGTLTGFTADFPDLIFSSTMRVSCPPTPIRVNF